MLVANRVKFVSLQGQDANGIRETNVIDVHAWKRTVIHKTRRPNTRNPT